MDVLRIQLFQNKAHFRKEGSITNKMTYPLPPFSTVIGAIHKACNFENYHEMDISIQGEFKTLYRQQYIDHCLLDSTLDDRNILIKNMSSDLNGKNYRVVAKAIKKQGSSFKRKETINIIDENLLDEYIGLIEIKGRITDFKKFRDKKTKRLKDKIKELEEKQKKVDKESEIYNFTIFKISEIRKLIKIIKNKLDAFEYENYKKPYSKFFTLATAPKSYEILSELKLTIHIKTDENTMKIIEKNIYNLKALGRSEDFVDLIECKRISLFANIKDTKISCYSAYLNFDLVKNNDIMINSEENGIIKSGTINFINKDYKIVDNKRIFNKKKVLYGSKYEVDEKSKNVYFDGDYIVNFN